MTNKDFLKLRKSLLKRKDAFQKKLDVIYTKACNQYVLAHSPFKKLDVVEIVGSRKKFKRYHIYDVAVRILFDIPSVVIYGWWLDMDGNPIEWHGQGFTLTGISNPETIILSENQHAIIREDYEATLNK